MCLVHPKNEKDAQFFGLVYPWNAEELSDIIFSNMQRITEKLKGPQPLGGGGSQGPLTIETYVVTYVVGTLEMMSLMKLKLF